VFVSFEHPQNTGKKAVPPFPSQIIREFSGLVCWGLREVDLHGIELDPARAGLTREILPGADLRVGDAVETPLADASFRLVIASTVFTSILDGAVRQVVAAEITRVIAPGGALLWYDFAVNNPRNPNVRKVGRRELRDRPGEEVRLEPVSGDCACVRRDAFRLRCWVSLVRFWNRWGAPGKTGDRHVAAVGD